MGRAAYPGARRETGWAFRVARLAHAHGHLRRGTRTRSRARPPGNRPETDAHGPRAGSAVGPQPAGTPATTGSAAAEEAAAPGEAPAAGAAAGRSDPVPAAPAAGAA